MTVAVSLDGVMLPVKDGKRQEKREQNKAHGVPVVRLVASKPAVELCRFMMTINDQGRADA